jgi:hypothetical protein
MDKSFLDKYNAQKDADAMARFDKMLARDEILSGMERGPIMEIASMAGGPGKFKGPVEGLVKLFPKNLDTTEAYPILQNIVNALKNMGKGEQEAAIKILKPKVLKDKTKIEDIFNNDIINNPNASRRVESMLNKNTEAYTKLDNYLDNLKFNNSLENVPYPKGLFKDKRTSNYFIDPKNLSVYKKKNNEFIKTSYPIPGFVRGERYNRNLNKNKPKDMMGGGVASLMPLNYGL